MITYVWIPNLSLNQVSLRVYCLNKQTPSPKNETVRSEYLLLLRKPQETWLWTHAEGFRLCLQMVGNKLQHNCSSEASLGFLQGRTILCVAQELNHRNRVYASSQNSVSKCCCLKHGQSLVLLDQNADCWVSCVTVGPSHSHKSHVHAARHPRNA